MATLELSATNAFKFFSLMTPFLLVFFLMVNSVINQDIKALIYILGTIIASTANIFIMNLIKSTRSVEASPFCNVFSFPFMNGSNAGERYDTPSITAMFISFTIAYICLPMTWNAPYSINYPFIIFLLMLLIIDVTVQHMFRCNKPLGTFLGIVLGFIFGSLWYVLIRSTGDISKSLLYYSDYNGTKTICSRPRKQYFKCDVYKNGQLVQNSTFSQ
tara:strand:+ start:5107 stop:5754 length:648 start_codon:yes stop_codon:yes gene_type:complete